MADEKGTVVVALERNIHTSQGKVFAGDESKPLPDDEAKDFIKNGLAEKKS